MADITITVDLSDLAAAVTNIPQPTVSPGVAPVVDWGTLPTPKIDWGAPPWDAHPRGPSATIDMTGVHAPSIDMTNARPPTITFPTASDIVAGLWAGFGTAISWEIKIESVP